MASRADAPFDPSSCIFPPSLGVRMRIERLRRALPWRHSQPRLNCAPHEPGYHHSLFPALSSGLRLQRLRRQLDHRRWTRQGRQRRQQHAHGHRLEPRQRQQERRLGSRLWHLPHGLFLRDREWPRGLPVDDDHDSPLHQRLRHLDGEHVAHDARDGDQQQPGAEPQDLAGRLRDGIGLSWRGAPQHAQLHRADLG